MDKNDILIKREKEPLQEIEWHLSPIGIVSNSCFRNIWHYNILIENMRSLHKIIDPTRYSINVNTYMTKRDNAHPIQTKIYWHNKISSLFTSAYNLLHNMTENDANLFGLDKTLIKNILDEKSIEYEVNTYRQKIVNTL